MKSSVALLTLKLSLIALIAGCKAEHGTLLSDQSAADGIGEEASAQVVELAFAQNYSNHVRRLLETLQSGDKITSYTFSQATKEIGALVSEDVVLTRGTSSTSRPAPPSVSIDLPMVENDTYVGVKIGSKVFVYSKEFGSGVAEKYYKPFTWFAHSILPDASLEEKVHYYLDSKFYEPKRLADAQGIINTVDFLAHFIPGYGGSERLFYSGETSGERLLGAVEVVGDTATFGLGSKIKAVKQGAAAIVITAASTRISAAAYKASEGTAQWTDGVDAFIATVEASLAAVTLVKIKIGPTKHAVGSLDEASLLSRHLGRSADDIYQNGISADELRQLVGNLPSLRKSGLSDELVEGLIDISTSPGGRALQSQLDTISCSIGGLGLMQSKDCYTKALERSLGGIENYPEFRNFNDAMTAAISWLKSSTDAAIEGTWKISNGARKNGSTQIDSFVGRTPAGQSFEINVHFHNVRELGKEAAHVNVRLGKVKTLPHFMFPGSRADVDAILKQIFTK